MLLFLLGSLNVWGEDQTVTWTVQNNADLGSGIGSGTITDNGGYSWNYERTLISGSSYTGNLNNGYLQIGKNGGVENLTFTTSDIPGTIKSVTVDCASYQGKHKVSITVGTTTYLASTVVPTWSSNSGGEKTGSKTGDQAVSGSISIAFTGGTRALYIKSITVVYNEGDAPDPVLESIAISGTPEKLDYEAGESFDPTGLVVTGTYNIGDPKPISSEITWSACKTEDGEYMALDENAVALIASETGIYIKATVDAITSSVFHVTGLSVTAALPKSSLIFTAACKGSGTANDGVKWTVESDAAESAFDTNRGVHYGTGQKAVSNIENLSSTYNRGFVTKTDYVILEYNTFVYTCVEATTTLLYEFIEYVKRPDMETLKIQLKNNKSRANLFYFEQLGKYNNVIDKMGIEYRKMLENLCNKGKNNFLGVDEMVGVAAVSIAAFAIVPITRELIYQFYRLKGNLAASIELQATFLEMNQVCLEANDALPAEKKAKIIAKQKKLSKTLLRLSDKLKVKTNKSIQVAKKDLKQQNKMISIDGLQDEVSNSPLEML